MIHLALAIIMRSPMFKHPIWLRFIRKGIDPAPLAENGLTEELLERLSNAAGPKGHNSSITGMLRVN